MSIKFICTCGKHLRARDEMAARRAFCPRCGNPVGIPSLQPTHTGTPAHVLTPAERLRRRRVPAPGGEAPGLGPPPPADVPLSAAAPTPPDFADPNLVALRSAAPVAAPAGGQPKPAVRTWRWAKTEALPWLYAGRALLLVLGLALVLTAATSFGVLVLPTALQHLAESQGPLLILLLGLVPASVLAYLFAYLECVFASAASGEAGPSRWPGRDLALVPQNAVRWVCGFLAGPIVPAAAGLFFWLNSGDLAQLDRLILAELGFATVAYWLLVMAAVYDGDRLLNVSPPQVAGLVRRLGWRAPVAVLIATALLLAAARLGWDALLELHESPGEGWLRLGGAWAGGLVVLVVLFHLLGRWSQRGRRAQHC
jgi:hypothetical protein